MAECKVHIDASELNAIVEYIAQAVERWPEERRLALQREITDVLDYGVDVFPEKHGFVSVVNGNLYAVLNRYGLNPVC